jgi:hypothetical protein
MSLWAVIALLCPALAWSATRTVNFTGMAVSYYAPEAAYGTLTMHMYCDITIINVGTVDQTVNAPTINFLNAQSTSGSLQQGAGIPTTTNRVLRTNSTASYANAAFPVTLNPRGSGTNMVRVTAFSTFPYNAASPGGTRMMCAGSITVVDPGNTPGSVIASGSLEYLANNVMDQVRMFGQQCPTGGNWAEGYPDAVSGFGNLTPPSQSPPNPNWGFDSNVASGGSSGSTCNYSQPLGPPPSIGGFSCGCSAWPNPNTCLMWDPSTQSPPSPRSPPGGAPPNGGANNMYWTIAATATPPANSMPGWPSSSCFYTQQGTVAYAGDQNFTAPPAPFNNKPMNVTSFPQFIGSQAIIINGGKPF